jgi:hypothetical protein
MEIEKMRCLEVGDIITFKRQSWGDQLITDKYEYQGKETNIKVKYKIVYKCPNGFPYVQKIDKNGFMNYDPESLVVCILGHGSCIDEVFDMHDDPDSYNDKFGDDPEDWCITVDDGPFFEVDEDYIDAAIFQEQFDIAEKVRSEVDSKKKEEENKLQEEINEFWRVKNTRDSLKLKTNGVRLLKKFKDSLDIGDTVYLPTNDTTLTLKVKTDDLVVFENGSYAVAYTNHQLKDITFYSKEPPRMLPRPRNMSLKELENRRLK